MRIASGVLFVNDKKDALYEIFNETQNRDNRVKHLLNIITISP